MLNNKISPFDEDGLRYNPNPTLHITREEPKSYVMALKNPTEWNEDTNESNNDQEKQVFLPRKNESRKMMTPRRPSMNRYEYIFIGNCFSCNSFGHKEIDCIAYPRNNQRRNGGMYNDPRKNCVNSKVKNNVDKINMNSFDHLFKYDIECYKCHNFGLKAQDCKSWIPPPIDQQNVVSNTIKV